MQLGYIISGTNLTSTTNIANNTATTVSSCTSLPIGIYMVTGFHEPAFTGTGRTITEQLLAINTINVIGATPIGRNALLTSGTNVHCLSVSGIVQLTVPGNINLVARYVYTTGTMTVGSTIRLTAVRIG